jgi:hypothetical protein
MHEPWVWIVSMGLLAACTPDKVDPTIAEAVKVESKVEKAAEEIAAKQKADREAAKAAKRQLEAKRSAEIEAATKLPADMPADLAEACDRYVAAYDAFMKSGSDREVQEFHDGRRAELGERRAKCVTLGSVQVAACGTQVLGGDYPSLSELTRHDAAHMLLESCAQKFGAV